MRKKVKLILVLAFVAALLAVCGRWWATRVTPSDVLSFPPNELRALKVCRNQECATLDQNLWPELLQRAGSLEVTWSIGWKGEESSDLYYLFFDWGGRGTFQVRLWTRPSIRGHIIGTFEKHACNSTWYYDNYSAIELYQWLDGLEKSGVLKFEAGTYPWCKE
jgi:hypothetical protein